MKGILTYKTKFGNLVIKEVTKNGAELTTNDNSGLVFIVFSNKVYLVGGHSSISDNGKNVRGSRHNFDTPYCLGDFISGLLA